MNEQCLEISTLICGGNQVKMRLKLCTFCKYKYKIHLMFNVSLLKYDVDGTLIQCIFAWWDRAVC